MLLTSRSSHLAGMASSRWSSLPSDILSTISKILNTDVDILRLRSVCSSWRYSIHPRLRPYPLPLKVPLLSNCFSNALSSGGHYYLAYTTIYRLSPPEYGPCAGDPSDGWLFRVSEVSPNCFLLLSPVAAYEEYAPGPLPKFLNLLNYRISEICKCYSIFFVDSGGYTTDLLEPQIQKISVVSKDYYFAVFISFSNGNAICWKYGQQDWSPINTIGEGIADTVVSNGKCYALSFEGTLFSFDSNLELTEIHVAKLPPRRCAFYLLEYKSDLYVLMRHSDGFIIPSENDSDLMGIHPGIPLSYLVFKKCDKNWEFVQCLPDEVIICCEDVSIILPLEDFTSYRGNCVHILDAEALMTTSVTYSHSEGRVVYRGDYDLAEPETEIEKEVRDSQFMSWPPPSWLLAD